MSTSWNSSLTPFAFSRARTSYTAVRDLSRKILLLFLLLLPLSMEAQSVPTGKAQTLDGKTISLPDIFDRRPTVIVLAFSRKASDESRAWCKRLFASEQPGTAKDVYGAVLLSQVPSLLRSFVTRSIRDDVSPNVRSQFFTVTENGDAWRQLAQFGGPDDVYIVVVGGDSTVQWRFHGAYSDVNLLAVQNALHMAQGRARVSAASPNDNAGAPISQDVQRRGHVQ